MSLKKSIQLQKKLFGIIANKVGAVQLTYDLMTVLNISKSSAYKRRRCQTILSLAEYLHLLDFYKLTKDDIFTIYDSDE